MKRNYSVFIDHVGTFCDRYCTAYSEKEYSIGEKFDRIKSIPLLSAVDLNLTKEYFDKIDELKSEIKRTGLKVNCVMVDTTADRDYRQGSFSSLDAAIRKKPLKIQKRQWILRKKSGVIHLLYGQGRTAMIICLKPITLRKEHCLRNV